MLMLAGATALPTSLTSLHLLAVLRHVVWANRSQELDVVIAVVLGHFLRVCLVRALQGQNAITAGSETHRSPSTPFPVSGLLPGTAEHSARQR